MGDDSATSPPAKIDIQSMSFAGLASRSLQEAYGQEATSARGRSETEGKMSEKEKKHSLTRRMTGDLGNKLIRKGSVGDNEAKKERKQKKKEQKQKEKEEKKKEKEEKNKDKKGLLRMPRKASTPKLRDAGNGVATNGTQPTEAPKIFKSSLEDVMAHQADKPELKIPIVLQVLTDAVMRLGGGHTEGLFRVPGDATEIQFLKNQLNEKDYEIKSNDPNVVAGALKLWFRELKPPLLIPEIYDECLINASKPDVLQKVIDEKLPEINKNVVYFTLKWLRMLAKEEYSSKTMMGIENLAMVFAPAFLRCPKTAIMMFNAAKEKEVVECLLKHTCYGPDEKSSQQQGGGGERGPPPPLPALPPNLSTAGAAPSPGGGFRNRLMAKFGDAVPPPAAATGEEAQQQPQQQPQQPPQQQEQLPQPALTSPVEETQQPQQRTNPPPLPTLPPTALSGLASAVSQSEGAPTNKFGRPAFAPEFGKSLAKFDFKAIDKDGNSLAEHLDDLDISLVGPDGKEMGCKVELQPEDVGLFFQPALPGDYKISIFYHKEHISGSPFVTEVGSSSLDIFVNSVTVFRFNATKTRESGKEISATTPATSFQLNIVGPEDKDVEGTIAEAGEGQYDVSWRPFAPGLYTIFIFFENETVQGSPFRVTIAQGGEGGSSFLPKLNATGAGGV